MQVFVSNYLFLKKDEIIIFRHYIMLVEASLAPMSPSQLKKLHSGKPVRVRYGDGVKVQVMPMQHKKLMKAHMQGKGMILTIPPMQGMGEGNVKSVAKDSAKKLIVAGTDRAVQAIEGSGMKPKLVRKTTGGNLTSVAKDSAKQLITASTDRAVRALEGSGNSRDFNLKETIQQLKEGRPFKKKDGSAPMSMQSISAGKPLGGKGKVSRSKKFNKWFKDIGQKFLPINKNLKPLKEAAAERGAQMIREYNNPEALAKSGLDLFQEELPQTLQAFKTQRETPVVYAEEVPSYSYPSFPTPPSYYPSFPSVPKQEEELAYEPVKWYGSGVKKGSAEMKARMEKLRSMRKKKVGGAMPPPVPVQVKDKIRKKVDKGLSMVGLGKPAKGSPEMKAKMAELRARKGKKMTGSALYPAGQSGGALYPAGYSEYMV